MPPAGPTTCCSPNSAASRRPWFRRADGEGPLPRLSDCAALVRRHDPDRYLCALFADAASREALLALYALNVEVSMVGDRVSEPLTGRIRLQWWRDSIDMLAAGETRRHAVLEALAVRAPDPAKLHRLVDARELDLEDAPFADSDALETYVADTSGVLSELALDLLGVADGAARDSAGHVARAWGLVGLLRSAPFHARARRMMVPADALRRHAVPPGAYLELRGGPELGALARETGELAAAALEGARRPARYAAAAPVLLPATLARLYLARLAAVDWNMFDPRVTAPVPHAVFRLVLARLLRRV